MLEFRKTCTSAGTQLRVTSWYSCGSEGVTAATAAAMLDGATTAVEIGGRWTEHMFTLLHRETRRRPPALRKSPQPAAWSRPVSLRPESSASEEEARLAANVRAQHEIRKRVEPLREEPTSPIMQAAPAGEFGR